MPKMRIMTIIGTRPEIIRLSEIIKKLDQYVDHILVHTGQNFDYELNEIFFREMQIRKPDRFLDAARDLPSKTIASIIETADLAFEDYNPDALLILGDTNSALAAIPAKRRKIPIFHMEAGNRCFDFRVPEEINRRIVDHISDINLPYTTIARDYLIKEGLPADQVIKTGSPLTEVLKVNKQKIDSSDVLERLGLSDGQYFVVSCHREENVDSEGNLFRLIDVLRNLADRFEMPIIISTHPRTKKRLQKMGILETSELLQFHAPFGYFDYVHLQQHAKTVLSDSGTITEESSLLNFPAINIRECHERPEGFEEASVVFTGLDYSLILQAIVLLEDQPRGENRLLNVVADYLDDNISDKIYRIILSYTHFVNANTWKKPTNGS